ncbi:uncharacterized protein LOC106469938 isoform X2 [Limulus polyphemus]|uniref:Uncharacterized protein LOC106469938 isoform X2 n=1 Tax=Limulus polyphemus TaxID=6850 RepID=A0ABM1TEB3_LIMPO|nr:uncharacterized protein LOC106469938 isoform X2 [Limulus polyphemus]
MVDITVKLIIYRLNESWVHMVEYFDNVLYTDESKEMLNIVNINFFGWFLFAIVILVLGKLLTLYSFEKASPNQTKSNEKDELTKSEKQVSAGAPERVSEVNGPSSKHAVETRAMVAKLEGIKRFDGDPNRLYCSVPQTHSPETRGSDPNSVDWINSSLNWVYAQCNTNLLVETWLCALNDRARRASAENGVLVEFENFQPGSLPPKLTDLSTSPELNNNIITICRVKSEGLRFKILTTRKIGQDMTSVHYDLSIERLEGKLKALGNTEELLFLVSFVDRPDIKLTLKPSYGSPKLLTPDQRSMEDVIVDIIINSIATASVDFHFVKQTDFPKFQRRKKGRESGGHTDPSRHPSARHEQRLLVKVIKATGLSGKKGSHQPYCVIEMDEPSQRFQTSPAKNTSNPFWDENFLFNLKNTSAEILFEIYDRGKDNKATDKFLGLGIVGVREIMNNPSQRQIIPLQSQPVTDGDVTGSLTVEFLFMEGAEVPVTGDAYGKRTGLVETSSRVTAGGTVITTTTFKKADGIEVLEVKADFVGDHSLSKYIWNQDSKTYLKLNEPEQKTETSSEFMSANLDVSHLITPDNNPSSPSVYPVTTECCSVTEPVSQPICISGNVNTNKYTDSWVADSLPLIKNRLLEEILLHNLSKKNESDRVTRVVAQTEGSTIFSDEPSSISETHDSEKVKNTVSHLPSIPPPVQSPLLNDVLSLPFSPPPALQAGHTTYFPFENDSEDNSLNVCDNTNNTDPPEEKSVVPCHPPKELPEIYLSNHDCHAQVLPRQTDSVETLTDAALRELESREKTGSPISADKSTLIIHSVHREVIRPVLKPEGMADSSTTSPSSTLSKSGNTATGESISSSASEKEEAERGRTRDRKSFIGTLRKRLSFRKNQSKSVEQKAKGEESISRESSRSFSSDRSRSVPGSRIMPSDRRSAGDSLLGVPNLNREGHSSARSSISEGSGLSASSSRTYIHEKSTLVVETNENGVLKHYVVPSSLANRSKWRKKGVKLHIYNDHIFVAKHLPGSTVCQLCGKNLSRRPGKQGYHCRDCNLICHKSCHVRVESFCPHSTINTMDMEYVQDPRAKSKSS